MYSDKHVLVKNIMNEQNMGLPLWALVEKTVQRVERDSLSGKEKFQA